MIEAGLPGFEISAWYVMFAPANAPKDIMQSLNAEVNKAIADPELRKSLSDSRGRVHRRHVRGGRHVRQRRDRALGQDHQDAGMTAN